MSRIGKNPVTLPKGVSAKKEGNSLTIKGPKGELTISLHPEMNVDIQGSEITVTRPTDLKFHRALHGTTRANIQNVVMGVIEGYKKSLELIGVGYRVELRGKILMISVGFSHQVAFFPPQGVNIEVTSPTALSISGIDKQLVGQVAAKIRSLRPPEPYKGKGIKYEGEYIRRKAGKTAKS